MIVLYESQLRATSKVGRTWTEKHADDRPMQQLKVAKALAQVSEDGKLTRCPHCAEWVPDLGRHMWRCVTRTNEEKGTHHEEKRKHSQGSR